MVIRKNITGIRRIPASLDEPVPTEDEELDNAVV
jgi:hypothetical protein